jgi:HK97 family phage portal protein
VFTKLKNALASLWRPMGSSHSQTISTYGSKWNREAPTTQDLLLAMEDTVYACVTHIADNVAKHLTRDVSLCAVIPTGTTPAVKSKRTRLTKSFKHLNRKGDPHEILDHPFLELMERPNDVQSWSQLIQITQTILDLCGTAYWYKVRHAGRVEAVVLLPTQNIRVEYTDAGFIDYFQNGFAKDAPAIPPSDMLVFKSVNPFDPYNVAGVSPVASVWQQLLLLREETDTWHAILKNTAFPSLLITPLEGEKWSPANSERISKQMTKLFRQGESNGIMTYPEPVNASPLSRPPRDLSALQLHDEITTAVYRAFHMPRPILDPQDSNLASATTAKRTYQEFCLEPRVNAIVDVLNRHLVAEYDDRLFLMVEDVVEKDQELELRERQQEYLEDAGDLQNNVITPNERRAKLGLGPKPWGDEPVNKAQGDPFAGLLNTPRDHEQGEPQPKQDSQEAKALTATKKWKRSYKSVGNKEEVLLAQELRAIFTMMEQFYLTQTELPNHKSIPDIDVKAFVALDDWTGEIVERVSPILRIVYERSGQRLLNGLGVDTVLPIPKLNEAMNQAVLAFAQSTMDTTSKLVDDAIEQTREQLRQGMSEGEANKQLTGRIMDVFENMRSERANLIAWTESSRARHTGEIIAAKETGLNIKKKWLAGSPNVCDHCKGLNGQTRDLDEPFAHTEPGPYGTVDAPPFHPHCFCTLQYVTD